MKLENFCLNGENKWEKCKGELKYEQIISGMQRYNKKYHQKLNHF